MIQQFKEKRYEIVEFDDIADIYVINTCTVTNMSDRKSRQFLRQAKKNNPDSIVVACGCYVQVSKEEIEKIPEIDLCIGTNEKNNIVEIVESYEKEKKKIELKNILYNAEFEEFGNVTYTEKTRAVIKVQDGCDRFCSYCIIPFARGKVRSRKPENVIEEIKKIVNNDIKEVVITGIHIASYGNDFEKNYKLIDLLEDINKIDGLERIRLGSIEPYLITEDFVNRLKKLDKICHHFHLSLQSGSTKILKAMNRRYTIEDFDKVVKLLRKTYEDVILTTDIIVGFPGEIDEDFDDTYEYLRKIKFYKMHIFKYSQRKGTVAARMENQVPGDKKEERSKRLLKLSDENEINYLESYLGKNVKVLFEENDGEYYKGHTENYLLVKAKSNSDISNEILNVNVIDVDKENLCLISQIS